MIIKFSKICKSPEIHHYNVCFVTFAYDFLRFVILFHIFLTFSIFTGAQKFLF